MGMDQALKEKIERCKTEKQVRKILTENNIPVIRETTNEAGCFSVWIDDLTRIYKPIHSKNMKVQRWERTEFKYSGIPVFFSTGWKY